MCWGARSRATALVMPASPALAAMTCARPVAPRWPVRPPMLITVPPPALIMCGTQAWVQMNAPSSTTASTRCQSSSLISPNGVSIRTAALFTSASMRPKRLSVASTISDTARGSVTSAMWTAAFPPALSIIATVSSAWAREVFAFTMTEAPPAASERAIARPMLRAAPVTTATLPANSFPGVLPTVDMRLLVSERRQPCGDRRKDDDEGDQQQHAGDERHAGEIDVAHGRARRRHALQDKEQEPEGGRGVADLQAEQHDEAEPDEIEVERLGEREEHWRGEQHHRQLIHEAAEEKYHAEHHQQHAERRHLESGRPAHKAARGAREGEDLAERGRAEDGEKGHHGHAQSAFHRTLERPPAQASIAGGEHQHCDAADAGGFGRRRPAGDHDADHDDDDEEHRHDLDRHELQFAREGHGFHRVARRRAWIEPSPDEDQHGVHDRQRETRDDARDEQRADVDLAERREQHGERRGRDDDRETAGAHDRAQRQVFAVAALHHLRHHQRADQARCPSTDRWR